MTDLAELMSTFQRSSVAKRDTLVNNEEMR